MIITESTLLIRLNTLAYPIYMNQVRTENSGLSFPLEPTDAQLLELGYAVVSLGVPPVADVVVEGVPVLSAGIFSQTWTSRAFSVAELSTALDRKKLELIRELEALRDSTMAVGVPYTFANLVVEHIQLRDGDRPNLTALRVLADNAKSLGAVDPMFSLRTYENTMWVLTPQQVIDLTAGVFPSYMGLLNSFWAIKDSILTATTLAGLPVIPAVLTA